VHRVNVTRNLDASCVGPRKLRHLTMTIETKPEKIVDVSEVVNARIKPFTCDLRHDPSSRQHMALVEYADAPARTYSSRYEIDLWMGPYRKCVYPHRVNRDIGALAGTNYLADDPGLFNRTDAKAYGGFFERVKAHIQKKYGVPTDMQNPYWAAGSGTRTARSWPSTTTAAETSGTTCKAGLTNPNYGSWLATASSSRTCALSKR